ncbi:MAG: TolC family protein [Sulfurimonas sp.]|uniref:TolC family protein n=1 Tax=Sulfurimonas sp. TaxID=2022749 RepID=UPI0025D5BBCA|nr:TolC family protein [Sulfurimonas sp.]MCK9490511.1 TolC family protein [Sulfurimonas sp.]
MILRLISLLLLTLSLSAKDIYTVDELIIKALENSPDLKISADEYRASLSRYDKGFASYLPKVDLSLSAGEIGMSDLPTNKDSMKNDTLLLGQLSLKQIIYDFGKTSGNVDSLKYDSDAYLNSNEQKISDKKRDVKSAYYNVLQAIALIDVNRENVKLNEAQLYRSQRYFESGIKTKIDVSDAKVELIKSKLDLKKSLYDLELAYASLDEVVGFIDRSTGYKVYSRALDFGNILDLLAGYALNLQDSIGFAYENRYELKKNLFDIKSAEANSRVAQSEFYPELYLGANYTKQKVDKFENTTPKDQYKIALNLDYNIYEGGASSAIEQEKKIALNIAHSKLNSSRLFIKKQTTQAYISLNKTRDSVVLSQSLLEVSSEKFDQAQKRYEYGLSDFIELQQARQGYIDAKSNLVVSFYEYYNAIALLDNAIGR